MPSTPSRLILRGLTTLVLAAALTACSPATGSPPDVGAGAGAADGGAGSQTRGTPSASPPAGGATPRADGGIPDGARPATVTKITDGDTIRVLVGAVDEAVRLLELDAPEVDGGCGAGRATAFVRRRVPVGSLVWLERDVSDRDRYGRLLRYVWTDDGRLLNAAIVRAGRARARLYPPDDGRWATMQRAEGDARRQRRGIWRSCGPDGGGGAPDGMPSDRDGGAGGCDPNYSACVPVYPPDIDCDRVDGPVRVLDADPHDLDGNHDGMGCEGPPA